MKKILAYLVCVMVLFSSLTINNISAQSLPRDNSTTQNEIPYNNEILIKFKKETFNQKLLAVNIPTTVSNTLSRYEIVESQIVNIFPSEAKILNQYLYKKIRFDDTKYKSETIINDLKNDSAIEYAEPNYLYYPQLVPNDPLYSGQPEHKQTKTEDAWNITTGNSNVTIAVIDTGVMYNHPDLINNTRCTEINGCDVGKGYDFTDINVEYYNKVWRYDINPSEDYTVIDNKPVGVHGHGTHVAGIAAAKGNNSEGISGVCPNCTIMPLRTLAQFSQSGFPTLVMENDDLINAIYYAANNNANIINMSIRTPYKSQFLKEAIDYAYNRNILVVAAAGNNSRSELVYPADFDNVLSVSATYFDSPTSYTANNKHIDVAAPGGEPYDFASGIDRGMWSTYVYSGTESKYVKSAGTSMAAPYVAGVVGLMLSVNPNLTPKQIEDILRISHDPINYATIYIGPGRVNALKAVQNATVLTNVKADITKNASFGAPNSLRDIVGTANGMNFKDYGIYYGAGAYPSTWTLYNNQLITTPVTNGNLLTQFDLTKLTNGLNTVKLVVRDTNNVVREDRLIVVIKKPFVNSPVSLSHFKIGDTITFSGDIVPGTTVDVKYSKDTYNAGTAQNLGIVNVNSGTTFATWNTSQITQSGKYAVKVTVTLSNSTYEDYIYVYLHNDLMSVTKYENTPLSYGQVADINSDGKKEMIYVSGGSIQKLNVLHFDGSLKWSKPIGIADNADIKKLTIPAIADLNGDGQKEIVTIESVSAMEGLQNSKLTVFNNDGTVRNETTLPAAERNFVAVIDLNNDNIQEIIVRQTNLQEKLYILSNTGVIQKDINLKRNNTFGIEIFSTSLGVAFGNFDNDDDLELVIAGPTENTRIIDYENDLNKQNFEGYITVYNLDGSQVAGWPKIISGVPVSTPVVGDVDANGNENIVVNKFNRVTASTCYSYAPSVEVYENNGTVLPAFGKQSTLCNDWFSSVSLSDQNYDSTPEIQEVKNSESRYGNNFIDFDNDGVQDIVKQTGDITSLANIQLYTGYYKTSYGQSSVVTDLDGDGKLDLFTVNNDYLFKNISSAVIFKTNISYNENTKNWSTLFADVAHTSRFVKQSSSSVKIISPNGGEQLTQYGQYQLKWNVTVPQSYIDSNKYKVLITLLKYKTETRATGYPILYQNLANGTITVDNTFPQYGTGNYKFKVEVIDEYNNTILSDLSDGFITVQ